MKEYVCTDVRDCLNELKTKINDARSALYYIHSPNTEVYPTKNQIYEDGYNKGLYNGLEMALGLLETVEDNWQTEE